jgi:ribosomal-protein-alanine N-acetyltransferase
MNISIQRAQRKNLDAIIAINQVSMPEHYSYPFWNGHLFRFGALFLVAKDKGKVVGYIMCHADTINHIRTGIIISVAVTPEYRRQGIGEELVKEAQRVMRENNLQMVTLQVRPSNKTAIAMYEKLRYSVSLTMPKYYDDGEDGLLMSVVL